MKYQLDTLALVNTCGGAARANRLRWRMVNPAREPKTNGDSQFSFPKRLNATAWRAIKTQLGL